MKKHKRDKNVELHEDYEENHVYLINGESHLDIGYLSVTRFMEQFFSKFDADEIIDKYYDNWQIKKHKKYYELSKKDIKEMWEANGKQARDDGTIMHKAFEDYANDWETKEVTELLNFMNWYDCEVSEPFRTEYTVYGEDEKIVGNIDFIYYNKVGELCIVDYKRTDIPNNHSFGKKCVGISMPDTKKSKHIIQLNIYKYLLEKYYDVRIDHIYNLYIKENDCDFIEHKMINMEPVFNE